MNDRKKILIADDQPINRGMLKTIFADDYDILEAKNGEQAITILEETGGDIDLILLDIYMPVKNGYDVLAYLKVNNLLLHIPVIVITADRDPDMELRVYDCGAVDIIRRPFVPEVVQYKSETLINLYSGRKELAMQLETEREEWKSPHGYDELTGLFNRQRFLFTADKMLTQTGDYPDREYVLVYSNIHNFRYYNIKHGINGGDEILKKIADHIHEIANGEISARFAGDHFVTMTSDHHLAEWIDEVNRRFEANFGDTGMQLKIGLYRIPKGEITVSAACEYAKLACDSIRNTAEHVCEYTKKLGEKIELDSYIIQHIDEALQNHEIKPYYQPVIRTISGQVCGMEALARWIDPEKGVLSPADFIPTLEENHLITKLDLYMLREICAGLREIGDQGKITVPISFNLSRMDFLECDIYAEVEKIVSAYGVPRDMINIEVTESMVNHEPDILRKEIQRFSKGGYQVWMDDFGSGYSSLNVLKDYQFDEVKLDMKFLMSFDEKSRKIIKSVISMAKEIGIQTLAEGVETQEQFDFLRQMGCEKVQGYLFSRPLSVEQMAGCALVAQNNMEKRAWRGYYQQMGATNFITDRPIAIVEYDGKDVSFQYMNTPFKDVLRSIGAVNMEMVMENINSPISPLAKQFRTLPEVCHVGTGISELIYFVRGHYVRLNTRCLAEYRGRSAYELEIFKLTISEADKKGEEIDRVFRLIHACFDLILTVELDTGKTTIIKYWKNNKNRQAMGDARLSHEVVNSIIDQVHPEDRKGFIAFTDGSTVKQRVAKAKSNYLSAFYRIKAENGAFVWKLHSVLYLPFNNSIIYCNRFAPVEEPNLIKWILSEYGAVQAQEDLPQLNFQKALYHGILNSQTINTFWKDKDRRFLGANEQFLRTYGFADASAILGKTDEEMGWHIADTLFADDERRVLEKGEVIVNRLGRCNIRGVAHNIIASKEPLYDKGEIVGLLGHFVSIDSLNDDVRAVSSISVIDRLTGLMSPNGLANVFAEYVDEWLLNRQDFAVINIAVNEYFRAVQNYGKALGDSMLRELAQIIADLVGSRGSCAREYAGNFVIIMRYQDRREVEELTEKIRVHMNNIHSLAGHAATVHPVIEIVFAEDSDNMMDLLGMHVESALLDSAMRWADQVRQKGGTE